MSKSRHIVAFKSRREVKGVRLNFLGLFIVMKYFLEVITWNFCGFK